VKGAATEPRHRRVRDLHFVEKRRFAVPVLGEKFAESGCLVERRLIEALARNCRLAGRRCSLKSFRVWLDGLRALNRPSPPRFPLTHYRLDRLGRPQRHCRFPDRMRALLRRGVRARTAGVE